MSPLVVGAILAVAALAFVLYPLIATRRAVATPRRGQEPVTPALTPEHERALAALREIEFEHATGKLSDRDFARLEAEYSRLAAEAGRASEPPRATDSLADDPVERFISSYRARQPVCSVCGPRPEADARYCSTCGRFLGGACSRCGTPIADPESRFCASCGAPLAP